MTKEELEKEMEEWVIINNYPYSNCPNIEKKLKQAYLAGAEPREKQIQALSKHCLQLQQDKGELIDEARKLEAQIEKQKDQLTKAKEIMNIATEGIKHWGIVGGTERPFEKQAEKLFNLFLDKVEQSLKEE